jgi:type IV secretion system protein VirB1
MSGAAAWLNLILACAPAVHPSTVQGIMQQESAGRPYAIGINRGAGKLGRQPASMQEAAAWARWLLDRGYNFDAGLMQINSVNWKRLGLTPENVFDPCTNIRAGASILTENYVAAAGRHGHGDRALLEAFSLYNTGKRTAGFTNGYVGKVSRQAARFAGVTPPFISGAPSRPSSAPRSTSSGRGGVAPASAWNANSVWGQPQPSPASPTPAPTKDSAE